MAQPIVVHSHSPEETWEVGRHLGRNAVAGDIFLLNGPLGAGKTCLTQGIAWGLDVPGYARSPTFVLVTRHVGRMPLHHMDLFRIGSPEEAWDLGMEDLLSYSGPSDGVCVIEWADKFADLFPENSVTVSLEYRGEHGEVTNERQISIAGHEAALERLTKGLDQRLQQWRDTGSRSAAES